MELFSLLMLMPLLVKAWNSAMENDRLDQGDMILSPEQKLAMKGIPTFNAIGSDYLWSKEIPYDFDQKIGSSDKAKKAIQAAIDDYEKYTCLRFVPRTNENKYLHFYQGSGCSSPVGPTGGRNRISLAETCWSKASVLHEIGHSLGFYHEQARPDRDNYIKIHPENIQKGMEHNFDKAMNIDSRGSPYDYRSIMHYDKVAFGAGKVTMETTDKYYTDLIGTGSGFSAEDIKQINNLYKCPAYNGPLPVAPTPECHDTSSYCTMWKGDYGCGTIKSYCPLTCGECIPVVGSTSRSSKVSITSTCKDEASNCNSLVAKCKLPGALGNRYKKMCPRSCGVCSDSNLSLSATVCKDTATNCNSPAVLKFCKSPGGLGDSYRKICSRSCGAC